MLNPDVNAEARRLKALFFCYFGYVGILSPYLSLYFVAQGFTVEQVGILLTLPQLMRIVSPPFWGWLADRGGGQAVLLRTSSCLGFLAVVLLPLASSSGFAAAAVLLATLSFVSGAQIPIGEARTLAVTAGDSGAYGKVRLWGSIGFILGVALVGPALDRLGVTTLPVWLALALAGLVVVVWNLADAPLRPMSQSSAAVPWWALLRQWHVLAFFAANFLMIFAHAALYVLYSLLLAKFGYSKTAIGVFWAVGVVAEVLLFRFQQVLFVRWAALTLLAASMAIAAIRFALIGFSDGSLFLLVVCQLMHAATFGLHHSAVMRVLHDWFEPSRQARAQALYLTTAYGLGGSIGGLVMSALWVRVSPTTAFFGAAGAAATGLLLTLGSQRLQRRAASAASIPSRPQRA